jgi:hypothetical protein
MSAASFHVDGNMHHGHPWAFVLKWLGIKSGQGWMRQKTKRRWTIHYTFRYLFNNYGTSKNPMNDDKINFLLYCVVKWKRNKFYEELIASFPVIWLGPYRKQRLKQFFFVAGICLPNCCLATVWGCIYRHTNILVYVGTSECHFNKD